MKNSIEAKLKKTISEKEKSFLNDKLLASYEDATKQFNELIRLGLTKKRGNNLLSLDQLHLNRITLESHKASFPQHEFKNNNMKKP